MTDEEYNRMGEDDWWERCDKANDPNTTPEELDALADDYDMGIRRRVARNKNVLAKTLIRLVAENNAPLHSTILANPSTPEAIRVWLNNGGFAGMTLAEFIGTIDTNE
jgi:hypothetical protein